MPYFWVNIRLNTNHLLSKQIENLIRGVDVAPE